MSAGGAPMDIQSLSEETLFGGGQIRVVMQELPDQLNTKPIVRRKLLDEFESVVAESPLKGPELVDTKHPKTDKITEASTTNTNTVFEKTETIKQREVFKNTPRDLKIVEPGDQQRPSSEVAAARLANILAKIKTLKVKKNSTKKKQSASKKAIVATDRMQSSGKKINGSSSRGNILSVPDRRVKAKSQEGHRFTMEENSQVRSSMLGAKRSRDTQRVREVSPVEHKVSKFDAMKCLLQNIHSVKTKIGLHPSKSPVRGHQSATRVKSQNFAHLATMGSKPKLLSNPTQPFHMASLHNLPKSRLMQKKPASSLIFSQLPKGITSSTRILPAQTSTRQLKHANKASVGYVPVPLVHPGAAAPNQGTTTIQATTLNIIGSTFTVNSLPPTLAKHTSVDETVVLNPGIHLPQQNASTEHFFWPSGALTKAWQPHPKPTKEGYCSSVDLGARKPGQLEASAGTGTAASGQTHYHVHQQLQQSQHQAKHSQGGVFRRTLSTSGLCDTKTLKKTAVPGQAAASGVCRPGTHNGSQRGGKGATVKKGGKGGLKGVGRV